MCLIRNEIESIMSEMDIIFQKIKEIKKQCEDCNALLVIVTKNKSRFIVQSLLKEGFYPLGESRVQEIVQKYDNSQSDFIHFIGKIQSNKCSDIVKYCHTIHSLDRFELVDQFQKIEQKEGLKRHYYIQVNLGNEPQKSGIFQKDLSFFLNYAKEKLDVVGLMTLPPKEEDPRPYFRKLKTLAHTFHLPFCSMGMSQDYKIALEEGANCIRIGSVLFATTHT